MHLVAHLVVAVLDLVVAGLVQQVAGVLVLCVSYGELDVRFQLLMQEQQLQVQWYQ
jgi:hypothetical protein